MAASRAVHSKDPSDEINLAAEQCLAYYNATLKAQLEPKHNGEFVAIHADTHEYVLAPTSGDAMRA
ncbi:MAG TPA: hypothetical protein VFW40_10795, partial [Capsulimonadaceae bacterium]|nr:hypothetical protein [Capsulimonadaceae bacterium]